MNILVTGAAGFIGMHLTKRLLDDNHSVTVLDNLNDYYDPQLKYDRFALLNDIASFQFYELDLADYQDLVNIFESESVDVVINLAAQVGVRYSLENPHAYIDSNL